MLNIVILQEKERQRITDHYKEYSQMQQQNTQKAEASKVPEYIKKAAEKAAEFNSNLNRERMEELILTYDTCYPGASREVQSATNRANQGQFLPGGPHPGQFQEYYKRYSPDELQYLPLNTVLYEPPRPRPPTLRSLLLRAMVTQMMPKTVEVMRKGKNSGNVSEGQGLPEGQEEPLQGRQRSRDKAAPPYKDASKRSVLSKSVPGYKPKVILNALCGTGLKGKESNKTGEAESLVHCSQCDNSGHPSCLDMTMELVSMIKTYPWSR